MPRISLPCFPYNDQAGKATTTAMSACLVSMLLFLRMGRSFFLNEYGLVPALTVHASLILISLFTIGCVVHMMIIGDMSLRDFRRRIEREAERARSFAALIAKERDVYERHSIIMNGTLSPKTIRAIATLRRISIALENRSKEVELLLQQQDKAAWCAAGELLRGPLVTDGDCCNHLILGEPIPPIEANELLAVLKKLLRDIEEGLFGDSEAEDTTETEEFRYFSDSNEAPVRQRRPTLH